MGLAHNIQNEPISQLNLREAILSRPDETVSEAVRKMREKNLGCTIIVDKQQRPIGIFTEALLRELLATAPHSLNDSLESQMAVRFPRVQLTDPISIVVQAMHVAHQRFVCVTDADERVVGITGQKGLVEFVAEHFPQQVMSEHVGRRLTSLEKEGA